MKRYRGFLAVAALSLVLCGMGRCAPAIATWGFKGQLEPWIFAYDRLPVLVDRSGVLSGKTITAIDASSNGNYSLALCSDSTLASWGDNTSGQLGNGNRTFSSVPVLVDRSGVLSGKTITALAAGTYHSLALCSDGTLVSWGDNEYGQLGNGTYTSSNVPVLVNRNGALSGKTVTAIASGVRHSVALCSDGTLAAWGWNDRGQLGNGVSGDGARSNVPVLVNRSGVLSGKTITALAVAGLHSLVLCADGTVAGWGWNQAGQLGNGTRTESTVPVLVNRNGVLSGKTITAIATGVGHTLALCSDGTLASWGGNNHGQLGTGNILIDGEDFSAVPVLVDRSGVLSGKTITLIAAGHFHNLALCSDGTLAAWGQNEYGALGNGNTTSSIVPIHVYRGGVLSGKTITALDAGLWFSMALTQEDTPTMAVQNVARAIHEGSAATPGSGIFDVTLTHPFDRPVTVAYQTANGTATAGSDYVAKSGTLTFAPGETLKQVTVPFIGDDIAELNEPLFLDIRTPVNATVVKSRGVCYIRNDDGPGITINSPAPVFEGNSGTTPQTFEVTLSAASTDTVTINWTTLNGTAGPSDFVAASGTLSFAPGETQKTITVQVKGDTIVEPTEWYRVRLNSPGLAILTRSMTSAYIRKDDFAPAGAAQNTPSR